MPLLDPTQDPQTPLPGESFDDFSQRRRSIQAQQAQGAQDDANAQFQRDQATETKALSAQGFATYPTQSGTVQPLTDPNTGAILKGSASPGGIVYGSDGSASRVTFPQPDQPKLLDPMTPEGGASTKTVDGNDYLVSPGMPWQYKGPNADAQAAQTQTDQEKALTSAQAVYGGQVTQAKARLAEGRASLKANSDALGGIPELADADPDDPKFNVDQAFSPTDDVYNERSGIWGGGGLTPAAQQARDDLANRKQQAQQLLQERQDAQQRQAAVQSYHDTAQSRLEYVTNRRAGLAAQRLQGAGVSGLPDDPDQDGTQASSPASGVSPDADVHIPGMPAHDPSTQGNAAGSSAPAAQLAGEPDFFTSDSGAPAAAGFGASTAPAAQGASVSPTPALASPPAASAPANSSAGQTIAPAAAGAAAKPYSIGPDGSLQLDPTRIPLGLLAAAHDGVISQDQVAQVLPQAGRAQMALDQATQQQGTNPSLADQLKAFGGSLLNGITSGIGTIVRSPVGQGVAGILDLPGVAYDAATGQPIDKNLPAQQAAAVGNAISNSTSGLVPDALKNTIGAKVGGFVGGVVPYVAEGALAPEALIPTLFASGFQDQYESAKSKLQADAQASGQPVDPDHVENVAKGAGLLGGAINTILGLPLDGAGNAVAKVFGGTGQTTIAAGLMNAFERGGPKAVGEMIGQLDGQGLSQVARDSIGPIVSELSKGTVQRLLSVGGAALKNAARDAAIGAGTQVAQNVVAQNLYDPNRSTTAGVGERALGFGLMGAAVGGYNEGSRQVGLSRTADEANALRASGNNQPGGQLGGGLVTNGSQPPGPDLSPADLAKPVAGTVVSSTPLTVPPGEASQPSSATSAAVRGSLAQTLGTSPATSPAEQPPVLPASRGVVPASVPSAPLPISGGTSPASTSTIPAGQAGSQSPVPQVQTATRPGLVSAIVRPGAAGAASQPSPVAATPGAATPGQQQQQDAGTAPDQYQQLSDRVNAGATSDVDGAAPSVPFQVLSRLKNTGAQITPDVARAVGGQAAAIDSDGSLDPVTRQAALKQLVEANKPPASQSALTPGAASSVIPASQAGINPAASPTLSTAEGSRQASLSQPASLTSPSAAPASRPAPPSLTGIPTRAPIVAQPPPPVASPPAPAPPAPAPLSRGDLAVYQGQQVQVVSRQGNQVAITPKGNPHLHSRVVDQSELQSLTPPPPATQPAAPVAHLPGGLPPLQRGDTVLYKGKVSKVLHVENGGAVIAPKADIEAGYPGHAIVDQSQLGRFAPDGELMIPGLNHSSDPPRNRQPVTAQGREGQQTIKRLTALQDRGMTLDELQQRALADAHLMVARDLNNQVLGPETKPTTLEGKRALQTLAIYDQQRSPRRPGDYDGIRRAQQDLQADFTAQRLAIEDTIPRPADHIPGFPDADELEPAPAVAPEPPITEALALKTAQGQVSRIRPLLERLGVKDVQQGPTQARSGVEFRGDGTLQFDPAKLAQSMTAIRDIQARKDIAGSPTGWFAQVLFHEGIHAADAAIARSRGQTLQQRYDALPNAVMPVGWQQAGRDAYGKEWEGLPEWKQKAEFTRMVLEQKWTGRVSEALYRFLQDILNFLKRVAGGDGASAAFKAHVDEIDAHLEAARAPTGETAAKPIRAPRSFKMPYAPTGDADVLDQIVEQGGMVSPVRARASGRLDRLAGDFDGAPALGGFYHSAVYGGRLMPDQMAEILHQNHGIGDGSTDGMWSAISKAVELRRKVAAEQQSHATLEKQASRFDKDAVQQSTAKGKTAINTANLSVGDTITVGNQQLKVIGLDPDTLDIELEDHTKYGVQKVADGETLYVEKVDGAAGGALGAASPGLDEDAHIPGMRAAQQTLANLTGEPINSRRTAFAPESDTLGVPRSDMPQVAAEHRGALANFLKARGIDWRNEDVNPNSLSPTQADFNPGKVQKARDWVGDTDRRILVSSDQRVIDGHHQWMGRLADHPNEPMPVVRLNGTARDILSQIHEFPSAGLEKAPDIDSQVSAVPTLRAGENLGDLLSRQSEDLRLVGERGIDHGARQQAQELAARQAEANRQLFDQDQQRLFAADPSAERLDPATVAPYLQTNGTPADRVADAASGIARSISRVAHGPMARSYGDYAQGLLDFGSKALPAQSSQVPADSGPGATAQERSGAKALTTLDPQQLREAFSRGATVSGTIRRLVNRQIPGFDVAGQTIATPADFAALLQPLRTPFFESLKVAFLDDANRIVHAQILHVGTLNESVASPRDILSSLQDAAAKSGGAGPRRAIIAHNHPSGDPAPSFADRQMTSRIREVLKSQGVDLVDHVITNGKTYYSFTAGQEAPLPGGEALASWEAAPRSSLPKMNGPDQLARAVSALRQSSDGTTGHVLYLSTKYNLLGVERVPLNGLAISKLAVSGAAREGAHSVILDIPFSSESDASSAVGAVKQALQATGVNLLDAATGQHASLVSSGILNEASPGEGSPQQTPDPSRLGTIKDLVDGALDPDADQRKRFVQYATVDPQQAQQLKADTGLNLEGCRRNLDSYAVRHVLNEHGDPAREIARGNAPLSREDFEKLPQILDHPDATILAGKNSRGQDVILSAKRVNGYYVIAEEVRESQRVLSLATMYKKSALPLSIGAGEPTPVLLQSTARTILQQAAEQFNFLHGGALDPDALGAAAPSDDDSPSLIDRIFAPVKAARATGKAEDQIASRFDAADTLAGIAGRHAGNSVRLDFPDAKDRAAASAVVEAGGQRGVLTADLAKVKASADPKLAAKYAPVYQHALDNLDRLQPATANYNAIEAREMSAAVNAGFDVKQRERYVAHAMVGLDRPDGTPGPLSGSIGAAPGAGVPKLSDAIGAGRDPGTMDLGDLTERRVARNQRLIQQKAFHGGLAGMKASDGKPVLSAISESNSALNPDGSVTSTLKVPMGYEAVQAGDNVLTVHKEYSPILKALYGESAVRQSVLGNALLNAAAFAKHGTVGILDTYHGMRLLTKEVTGFQTIGYGKGMAAQDYADSDLPRAVKAGEISQTEADYARQARPTIDKLLAAGLNTGKVSDNLLEAARQHNLIERIPLIGGPLSKVNEFIFHTLQRGAMTQAGVVAYNRIKARFPELSDEEAARQAAKTTNEYFGNLQSQGFLKSKTMQDVARLVLLAPQWTESQARTEARGAAQAAKVPLDAVTGRGLRVGIVAQAIGGAVISALIANQALNMFTRGKPTWQNPEEDHKWDAFIPGGAHGFFFSPLSIAAEYSHALLKYMNGGESALDAAAHVASNKLSGGARAVKDLVTGKDYAGRPFGSMGERLKAAATDALPLPMPAGPFVEKDPKAALGYGLNHQSGALEKQLLAMAGLKVDNALGARSRMYRIAQPYRGHNGGDRSEQPSQYTALRQALDSRDQAGVNDQIRALLQEGKTLHQIGSVLGVHTSEGPVSHELFTGSAAKEAQMVRSLTPAQRSVYAQAQRERRVNGEIYRQWALQLLHSDPEVSRLVYANGAKAKAAEAAARQAHARGALAMNAGE